MKESLFTVGRYYLVLILTRNMPELWENFETLLGNTQ